MVGLRPCGLTRRLHLNELDEVALLGVSETVTGFGGFGHGYFTGFASLDISKMSSSTTFTSGAISPTGMASAKPW